MKRSLFHSLRFRFLSLILAMLILLGVMVLYNGYRVIHQAMIENGQATIKHTSQILNLAVSPSALTNKLKELAVYLSELIIDDNGHQGLTYIIVAKEDNTTLLMVGMPKSSAIPNADASENFEEAISRGLVHVRQPILLFDNSIGYLQYGLSTELLRNAAQRSLEQGAVLVSLSLLVSTILILLLGVPVVKRVGILIKASEAFSQGNYQQSAPEQGSDEIAELAHYFNLMSSVIRQRILALEEIRIEISLLNQELEWRVEERTQELAGVNQRLKQTIEHLKQTQESLIHSEKLAGLGALVAGIAHELNTPIGNALMAASTLDDRSREFISDIKNGLKRSTLDNYLGLVEASCPLITRNLERATELITSFKHVAVDQSSSQRREFNLCQVVCEVSDTLRHTFKNSAVMLQIDIPDTIIMNSYPGPLGQVVTNLINNSLMHAFNDGRSGYMRFYAQTLDADSVSLEFCDNGTGIAPEHIKHIFDPFFTTRLGQGGSGLGLSIVHNIASAVLGGHIRVNSDAEIIGTCFILDLPLHAPEAPEEDNTLNSTQ